MFKSSTHNEIVSRSLNRCIKYHMEKGIPKPKRNLNRKELNNLIKENSYIIEIARPFMEILYDFLNGSGFSLYLTDKNGIVLTIIGDKDILIEQAKAGIVEGADMSEKSAGTNAIGTALFENLSVQVSGKEHFINIFQICTCSASVIHNEQGNIIGCLNLTGKRQLAHPHTLGLVVAAVKSIENHLKLNKSQNELFKAYQYLNKIMNSIDFGILAVDNNGIIKAINNSACNMLCIDQKDIIDKNAYKVLYNWQYILNELKSGNSYEDKEILYSDKRRRFNLNVYPIRDKSNTVTGMVVTFKDIQNVYNLVNKYTSGSATYTFDDIIGSSEKMINLKKQLKSISNSPSTVLIQGESGTGKELIAQSIHNDSSRKNNSFIAINCGAIPKNLIESELFGYEDGSFTGAKHGGRAGKFELANGGTLFLDEIGEMPLDMQVNLLRVLQENCITRIGGNRCVKIDIRIIAATNKNLREEIHKGTFREDLYYRLNVIPIYVPPLRERDMDIKILINYFLKIKAFKLKKPIPIVRPDIYQKLLNYNWPGNVRELENCIENIVNMNGNTSFNFENSISVNTQTSPCTTKFKYDMYSLKELEKEAITNCMSNCNGNIAKASKILGINRSTLYTKIKKYQINFS
ncbi:MULTISPECIES: sigma-54-dependent Fis family transcriptional regulator [Clostridium]|uniref:Acetoin dehydrogenase operon transcriptional activator AcoR n=2 Tax=Clostridium TaxID=1485 RepID=D8GLW9_CLOLD|nr:MULTISPECIES: sigma-54-dependent Fis family transcriptional regulator [Clostridium]ADK15543.1 signal-transduction and transcriptional-control protein [Clostridium ljungdahlii DSM 13528]AGY74781.1 sigma-54-dependent Fis family transcriptional regulator [Clostridium autoethanogenum DSM 10061]ALU34960.1 PAS modulated sigma54 specific transcriptional regulator Fis family [Clostridium autoethanogenum DSM 10061]OAA85451.1 Acetoin dehydrogenase operon transcriptional activator AcoR [Clostridium lju